MCVCVCVCVSALSACLGGASQIERGQLGSHDATARTQHFCAHVLEGPMKRVLTRTMTIYAEAKIDRKINRNGLRMHLPRANNT